MTNSKRNIWVIDDVYGASDSQGQFYQREFLGRFSRPDVAFTFFSGRDEFLNEYAVSALETYMSQPELKRPDLILLDVNFGPLPLGYDFLTWLGLNHPEIPVVMLTSLERDANLKQALDLGAVDFISKSEERPQVFWGVVERYLAADRNEWLIGQHGQFLQALYLLQRFAQGDRHCLLLQGMEPSEKTAAVAYVGRLLSAAPVTLSANAIEKTDLSKARLVIFADADECELPAQVALATKIKTLPPTTRVIATTTDYLAARVKVGEVDRSFYDLISEEVVHLPSLRERLSDVGHLLRHAIAGQPGAKRHVRSPPDWVVERAMMAPALVELSDIRAVAAAVVAFAGNRDSLERELDGLLGSPVTGETGTPTREGSREQISDVERFLERVASHRSVYTVEHDGAELVVFPDVFSPRYSHSSDFLIQMLPVRPGDRVVDVGCGTGVLGIAALRRGAEHATFIDVNPAAVSNTQTNLDRLGLASRGRIVLSDVYQNLEGKFDLIISNPPFWNKPAATMLERSCYDENYTFLRKLIEGAALRARDGARLAIVMSNQSDTALVQRLLAKYGWSVRDHRMAAARTGRGGSNHVRVAWVCDRDPEV